QEIHRFVNPTVHENGRLRWDLPGQWEQIKRSIRLASARSPRLDGIGVDTWGVDFALLDCDRKVLSNPVHYRDPRTDGVMERTIARVGRQTIFESTGIQFLPFN